MRKKLRAVFHGKDVFSVFILLVDRRCKRVSFNRDDLERVTRDYWDRSQRYDLDSCLKIYICEGQKRLGNKSLLEAELKYAKDNRFITAEPCETLVLLVGYSLEPLLQSVCVYKPQKIILVLNEEGYPPMEEWHDFAHHVTGAIDHLQKKGMIVQKPQFCGEQAPDKTGYPTRGEPAAVFKTLVDALQAETGVVIDVTGGKKSMVTGAFMYAAYAGARISYVDFEEYNRKCRRPYGFSCKIGELSNPYQEFALREWERVRGLYERYQFREASGVLLDSILSTMVKVIRETKEPMQLLGAFLDYYEKWDRGDYRSAKQTAIDLEKKAGTFKQPSAITELGDKWYQIDGSGYANHPEGFYGDTQALQVYVYDELKRIRRLIDCNQDYRSAFLRAGGVNEIIMLARVVGFVDNAEERNSLLGALEKRTPYIWDVFKALTCTGKTELSVKKDIPFKGYRKKTDPDMIIPRPFPMTAWWKKTSLFNDDDGWERFLDIRNDLAHKYFSVPLEWAVDALKFAEANFEDFLGQPVSKLPLCAAALSWSELCELCGMHRFLPQNLR